MAVQYRSTQKFDFEEAKRLRNEHAWANKTSFSKNFVSGEAKPLKMWSTKGKYNFNYYYLVFWAIFWFAVSL